MSPHRVLVVSIELTKDGGMQVTLEGKSPVTGVVPPVEVEALRTAAAEIPAAHEDLPGNAAARRRWDQLEETFGIRAGAALSAAEKPVLTLLAAIRELRDNGEQPLLMLTVPQSLEELPWELVSFGSPPQKLSMLAVVGRLRRSDCTSPTFGPRLRHLIYAPEPSPATRDETIIGIRDDLELVATKYSTPVVPLRLGTWPQADEPGLDVLHIVIHGHLRDGALYVETAPDGLVSVLAFTEAIAVAARQAALVVLWSCHGAGQGQHALDTLAGRLIAAGARTVLSPTVKIPAHWARIWLESFHDNVLGRSSVLDAAWQARAALSVHQRAHRLHRTRNFRLYFGTADPRIDTRLFWSPPGWPPVDPALADLLTRAWELAREHASGFVGLEHLMGAIASSTHTMGPLSAVVLGDLWPSMEPILRKLSAWSPRPGWRSPIATPRLVSWGETLMARGSHADAETLWALAADAAIPSVGPQDPLRTFRTLHDLSRSRDGVATPPPHTLSPPLRLEVVGGPEDGTILAPAAGQSIGRFDPDPRRCPDLALYERTLAVDMHLKRRHLTWIGAGSVQLHRHGHALIRMGGYLPLPAGTRALLTGDLIQVTEGTTLRAIR